MAYEEEINYKCRKKKRLPRNRLQERYASVRVPPHSSIPLSNPCLEWVSNHSCRGGLVPQPTHVQGVKGGLGGVLRLGFLFLLPLSSLTGRHWRPRRTGFG